MSNVPATQADRDMAEHVGVRLCNFLTKFGYTGIYFEPNDNGLMVQSYARHREATETLLTNRITELEEALQSLAPLTDWLPYPHCVTMEDTIRSAFKDTPEQ